MKINDRALGAVMCMALTSLALLSGCHQSESGQALPAATHQDGGGTAAYYGERGADSSWPRISADTVVSKSDNLLAKNFEIILDASGSMTAGCDHQQSGSKWDDAMAATREFGYALPADANLGLWVFDASGVRELVPLSPINMDTLTLALRRVTPGGTTPLRTAMTSGYRSLEAQGIKQLGNGEYHLVVVTDGEANLGEDPVKLVEQIAERAPVIVHAIGFCVGETHSLDLPRLTRYVSANDSETLRKGLGDVMAEAPSFDATAFSSAE